MLYAGSKYFISFSSYEGFGLSAIEAVRHGAIPICYANSSFSQIFSDYPFFLVDSLDINSFKEKHQALELMDRTFINSKLRDDCE